MNMPRKTLLGILVSGSLLGLAACGGGGGGGGSSGDNTTSGLSMPDKLSVVTAKEETTAKVAGVALPYKTIAGALTTQTFGSTSDYATDQTHTWVHDESMNSLGTVNMILCLMEQTKASDMVNQGAYVALVNEDKCEEGKNQSQAASSGGQSSGDTVEQLNRWVIESTRANNSAPQYVKIWIPGEPNVENPMDGQNMLVGVTITEGASATKPFGAFTLTFAGLVDAALVGGPAGTMVTTMRGTLVGETTDVGNPHFRFINAGGEAINSNITQFRMEESADVILNDAAGTGGVAKTKDYWRETRPEGTFEDGNMFAVAFDQNHFLRGKYDASGATPAGEFCLDRNAFNTNLWRYNLYFRDAGTFENNAVTAGQRVERNSGFPFRYTDAQNVTYNGHAGYWGIWMEDESKVAELDGKTITKFSYSNGGATTENFTAHVAPGKATLRVAHSATLADFEGMEFFGWVDHPDAGLGYPNDGTNTYDTWQIKIQNGAFAVAGGVNWGNNGPVITAFQTPAPITFSFEGESLWLWSDALGGNVVYNHSSTPANAKVVFYSQEFVYPSDMATLASANSIALSCWERCPRGGLTQADITAMNGDQNQLYYTTDQNPSDGPTTFHHYTLELSNGSVLLRDSNNNAVVSAVVLNLSSLGMDWGLQTGEMIRTSNEGNLAYPWEIYQAPETFRWETGNQNWNRMVTVTDTAGTAVSFDKPLNFTYQVDAADVLNAGEAPFAGQTFMLQYGGVGELWGFPWTPDPKCSDATKENCRWYPGVNLKNGVELQLGTTTFVVKGIEGEQSMDEVNVSNCSALSLGGATSLTLPTTADLGSVTHTWAQRPNVTDAPAVIDGEVQ